MKKGQMLDIEENTGKMNEYREKRLKYLPEEHHRFEKPHIYKVGLSEKLNNLRNNLVYQIQNGK
jgi:nicotinate phosphoribosyltransferase